jgi:hypothetical protein
LAAAGGAEAKQSARLVECINRLLSDADPSQRVWLLSVQGFQDYFSGRWESARSALETVATEVEHLAGKTMGDHRDVLIAELEKRGYTVKRAGG